MTGAQHTLTPVFLALSHFLELLSTVFCLLVFFHFAEAAMLKRLMGQRIERGYCSPASQEMNSMAHRGLAPACHHRGALEVDPITLNPEVTAAALTLITARERS